MEAMSSSCSVVLQGGLWRKGPWTAMEDRLLTQYVQQQGEGCWNSVAKLTGLRRSGKSCRLRWVNYLRPDLKHGKITPDEETVILQLHAMLGNRWSAIARCLPGRTDNEIKNYWRTHFKTARPSRRARAHLLRQHQHQLQLLQQRQYHHTLQLLHHHRQVQMQQQSQELLVPPPPQQQQQQRPLDDGQVNDVTMMTTTMTGGGVQGNECCLPCPASTTPELPADDDDALWDSLWRLVDGEGDSGEFYASS